MSVLVAHSESDVEEAVRAARSSAAPLEIVGGGTKRGLGRPSQAASTLSTAALSGITLYEPSELVVSARAGTPLAEVERTLAGEGQRLAFEPVTLRGLYDGAGEGEPTIGALAACNLSGSRRINAGAARDGLIGVRVVTGRGETIKSGGRVMKNVTGLDLVKLMAGSLGTLGVLTEVTWKVLPRPETEATLVFDGLDDHAAVRCLSAGLCSPWEVTGAAHLPAETDRPARTLLRIEGFESQIVYRGGALAAALAEFGTPATLAGADSAARWREVAEGGALAAAPDHAVWRISTAPGRGPSVAAAIRGATEARLFYDWGGGLVWVAVPAGEDAQATTIRPAVATHGGHATLLRADDALRGRVEVFQPLPEPVEALSRRLKESFDPDRVLNPGRMYAGV